MTTLADEISRRRAKLRMSQINFAMISGLNQATVRRLERGQTKELRMATKSGVEVALSWAEGMVDRILDGTATRSEIDEVVKRGWDQALGPSAPFGRGSGAEDGEDDERALAIGRAVLALIRAIGDAA